jgi:haloalkane dehalogenase
MADPAFGTEACLRRWQNVVSETTVRYPSVGHYVPEELGPALVDVVRRFLSSSPS